MNISIELTSENFKKTYRTDIQKRNLEQINDLIFQKELNKIENIKLKQNNKINFVNKISMLVTLLNSFWCSALEQYLH